MQALRKYRYLFVALSIISATLILDVVSKMLVVTYIPLNAASIVVIPYLFSFTHVRNTGAAFSFGADNPNALTIFIVMTAICMAVLAFAIWRWGTRSKLLLVSLALIFSGAMGNWIDRVSQGYVVDFINFEFWKSFATFNVADICVCFGAAFFIVYILFFEEKAARREKARKEASAGEHGGPAQSSGRSEGEDK